MSKTTIPARADEAPYRFPSEEMIDKIVHQCDFPIIQGAAGERELLNEVFAHLRGLLSALRAVELACVLRVAVDGGVVHRK